MRPEKLLIASQILTEKNLHKNNLVGNPVPTAPGGGFSMIFARMENHYATH
jgi:hypothetical protein